MEGENVLHPMGWDSFGLPAENYAIKTGVHPDESTHANIKNFTRQIKSLGFSYDWNREITTCNTNYYRWTQWWFLFLYEQGLAYRKEAPVNWCEDCKTVLANEQVEGGKCERCQNEVRQKKMSQWYFRITEFMEDQEKDGRTTSGLISGLEKIDWPNSTKVSQEAWIGKSSGAEVDFQVCHSEESAAADVSKNDGSKQKITVFTTRPDTLYGCTYLALAPEGQLVQDMKDQITNWDEVEAYIAATTKKSELDRQMNKEKTGVQLAGVQAVNPVNGENVPVWIADYVLAGYGTGAIMAVPAHDERDFEFATKFGIEIKWVICPGTGNIKRKGGFEEEFFNFEPAYVQNKEHHQELTQWLEATQKNADPSNGYLINSGDFSCLHNTEAKVKMIAWLEENGHGREQTTYKLRDWLVSRQRYWGAPIPITHCPSCGEVPVPAAELPVELPTDVDFMPTGESPLTQSKSFHDVSCPKCGSADARRESDTMDTFVCSSWYFFRYADPQNTEVFASKEKMTKWCPVDLYVGGAEHTVLHLLYSRFFTKVAHRAGLIDFDEPFLKLRHQGMILGPDSQKMSKSRGNVINPDEIVAEFGADTLRVYEMFMGPFEGSCPWSTQGVVGVRRFLDKVWRIFTEKELEPCTDGDCPRSATPELKRELHKTIKKVTEDVDNFDFNTAISQMMIFVNFASTQQTLPKEALEKFLKALSPFAPHLADELWEQLGNQNSIQLESWPTWNPEFIKEDQVTLVVQVNGKVRAELAVAADITKADAIQAAKQAEKAQQWLADKTIVKEIFVPGKLVNFVVTG
jgi:leucyl-tRNA synthetase